MNFFRPNFPIPPNYEKTPTEDGSFTFKSLNFDENCHSTGGAVEETVFNYINTTQVNNLSLPITNIFEVGFGLGIGAILSFIEAKKQKKKITFYSIEIDEKLVLWFKENTSDEVNKIFPFKDLKKVNPLFYKVSSELGELIIFIGDAFKNRESLMTHIKPVDKVFQDAFSPKRNPDLWTKQWFEFLKKISSPKVILSTYSASHGFRKTIRNLGFYVYNKKGFAQKRSMTVASLSELNDENLAPWK